MILCNLIICKGGGNYPVVAVPLVALGTQSGIMDIVDVSANAVAASFSVHNGTVRGLRWLGNSRLVSFSYTQVCYIWIKMSSTVWEHHTSLRADRILILCIIFD